MWTQNHRGEWESTTFYYTHESGEDAAIDAAWAAMKAVDPTAVVDSGNTHNWYFRIKNPPSAEILAIWERFKTEYPA